MSESTDWLKDPTVNRMLAKWPYKFDERSVVRIDVCDDDYRVVYAARRTQPCLAGYLSDALLTHFLRIAWDEWKCDLYMCDGAGNWAWWEYNLRNHRWGTQTYPTAPAALLALFKAKLDEMEEDEPEWSLERRAIDAGTRAHILDDSTPAIQQLACVVAELAAKVEKENDNG